MISICIDVNDGFQPKDKLTGDAISNSIQVPPNLMEITSYALYLPFTMIGPVVPFNYFKRYVNGEFKAQNGEVRGESTTVAVRRFLLGILFTVLHEGGKLFITADYLNTPQFFENSLLLKIVYTTIWYRFTFYRYVGAFLFAEGAGILCGMGYKPNGKDSDEKWSGCRNVHVTGFLLGSDYQSVVESFNIATNTWSKNYVFKRLRFLGNRTLSQAGTLMYLALWHGYHLGYFLLFGFEFLCFLSQDRLYSIISRIPNARNVLNGTKVKWMTWLFGKVMITTTMGFGFLTFGLIKTKYWWDPLMSQYAWGYVLFLIVWPAIYYLLDKVYPDVKKEKKEKKEN
uniref:Lysophospholipid acyltransferase 5 n=1 Tax=Rhabditophanes sp. KR3021 TaxID=114890 RepID=A0AC35TRN6_9BILA